MNYTPLVKVVFAITVLFVPLLSSAAVLYSQEVALTPGWNIVSTPKVLESHTFSAAETSENFDIFLLDASESSGWATMATVGQSEFEPLHGYFVNNKTGSLQTLTFNYKADTEPNERLFSRNFETTGWYSFGIANPTYALQTSAATSTDTNNPAPLLNALFDAGSALFDSVIDFTDGLATTDINAPAISDSWQSATGSDLNNLNDFRETKGYAIYITEAGASYSGFQNNTAPEPEPEPEPTEPGIAVELVSISEEVIFAGETTGQKQIGEFKIVMDITALGSDIYIDKSATRDAEGDGVGSAGSGFMWSTTTESTTGTTSIAAVTTAAGSTSGDFAYAFKINEGQTRRLTLTVTLEAGMDGVAGIRLFGINWTSDSADTTPDNFYTADMEDFKTDLLTLLVL